MEERVVLVDENNNEIGTEEKLTVHKAGKLHHTFLSLYSTLKALDKVLDFHKDRIAKR